jgi:PAS domain S-box-containing protein
VKDPEHSQSQIQEELAYLRRQADEVDSLNQDLEKTRAEKEAAEKKFRAVFDKSLDALVVIDGDSGTILEVNPTIQQVLGYSPDQILGQHFSRLLGDTGKAEKPVTLDDIRVYGTVFVETVYKADGSVGEVDLTVTMIPWGDGTAILAAFRDVSERVKAEKEREKLIRDLQDAMDRIETLSGLLPICMHCKKIRNDGGYWQQVESYVEEHSKAEFSHGICPECIRKHYPELADEDLEET